MARWIRTEDGTLVNLDQCLCIDLGLDARVEAGQQLFVVKVVSGGREIRLRRGLVRAEAEDCLKRLSEILQAETV